MTRPIRSRAGVAALAFAVLVPAVALGQDDEPSFDLDLDALKERFDRAWDSVVEELEPAFESLARTLATMERIDSLDHYEEPVMLENGDILIRRKADAPPLPDPAPTGDGVRL